MSVNPTSNLVIDLRMYRMSGIGRYLQLLLPALIPLLDAPQITAIGDPALLISEVWASDPRIRIAPYNAPIFSIREQLAALTPTIRQAEVFWAPQYNFPLLYRGKLIVTIHDLCQLAHPETLSSNLQRWYSRHLITQAVLRAEAVLCVSEFTASEVQRLLHINPSRLVVAYPQVDSLAAAPRISNQTQAEPPYFLVVGNVKKHKNLRALISAFTLIHNKIPHNLVIVGKRDGFLNMDRELSLKTDLLAGRIMFTGFVFDDILRTYYKNAEALVFPSFYEGFGFPLVEAMEQGCPVACSNVSSLPEIAGDAALLFNPFCVEEIASALMRLAQDSALREILIQRGFSRMSFLRARSGAQRTATTINKILIEATKAFRRQN